MCAAGSNHTATPHAVVFAAVVVSLESAVEETIDVVLEDFEHEAAVAAVDFVVEIFSCDAGGGFQVRGRWGAEEAVDASLDLGSRGFQLRDQLGCCEGWCWRW